MRSALFALFLFPFLSGAALGADAIKLIFAGDVMSHEPQTNAALVSPGVYDFRPNFRYVKPLLESADLAIGNLELSLAEKPPYTGYPRFRAPDALADALKDAGFDVLVTANNHSNDDGGRGVKHTIEVLKRLGFLQTGTFADSTSRIQNYPLLIEKNGFRLALLNYTYGTNGIPDDAPTHVNLIDPKAIETDMAAAQKLKPDAVIVFLHWGLEYQLTENAEQRALAEQLYAWGADLVVGAHPHVVQPIRVESWKGLDGQIGPRLVAYSLGNFISNQKQPHTDGGILFEVELRRDSPGARLKPSTHRYYRVWRAILRPDKKSRADYVLLPVEKPELWGELKLGRGERKALERFAENTEKRLGAQVAAKAETRWFPFSP